MMRIRSFQPTPAEINAVAAILVAGFADRSPAWPTLEAGINDVATYSTGEQISLVATVNDTIVGWIRATPQYQQFGWELHPLVVAPTHQHQGVGKALVAELCTRLAAQGATTLYAWSDDESVSTSLGGKVLLPNTLDHLQSFSSSARHAGGFYLKQGFVLCGVIPDANGRGKPDILFVRPIN